jgi:hypothetical protein
MSRPAEFASDAFLSYSRADQAVAEGLHKGLHRIARRPGRLHALRVFRDRTDLAASPSLWGKITEALDRSRYLIAAPAYRALTDSRRDLHQGRRSTETTALT